MTRQRCEVYSRVVGYIRPIRQWNPGKVSEYKDRTTFNGNDARKIIGQKTVL